MDWCREIIGVKLKSCSCGKNAVLMELDVPTQNGCTVKMYQVECTECDNVLGLTLKPEYVVNDWNNKQPEASCNL